MACPGAGAPGLDKYSRATRFPLQKLIDPANALKDKDASNTLDPATAENFRAMINASVANSTWGKYSSAMSAFSCFEASQCTTFSWPLSVEVCRAFTVWGVNTRKWQHSTARAYLSAIKFVHHIKGLTCVQLSDDPVISLLLKGALHNNMSNPALSPTRRVVSFPMLLLLTHRIAVAPWSPVSKQVIYAACTTAFFASTRMIEILATSQSAHSPASDLTWQDVLFTPDGTILIRIKQPKSGEREGEYVDLFRFPGYNCCPVKALSSLKTKQQQAGVYGTDLPVFRFASGANLTKSHFNKVLADLLKDVCAPGIDSVSCHSFRAGIPSTLSLFPELATSDLIKGWGRWQSDCYTKYTRLQLPQRQRIFGFIAGALQSVQPQLH